MDKLPQIEEAEKTLIRLEENYLRIHIGKIKTEISDLLEDMGGQRIDSIYYKLIAINIK